MQMKKNMGKLDIVLRILAAIAIAGLCYSNIISGTLAIVLIILAGILLLTSFISFCPLYYLFRMNTCKKVNNN
jgi:hypothetical protein